jgi:hypothetical protein
MHRTQELADRQGRAGVPIASARMDGLAWFLIIGQSVFVIWLFARRKPPTDGQLLLGAACFVASFALALWVLFG